MPSQFDPPSGTRDFLAAEFSRREHAFEVIRSVFGSYGFEPLQTPAFERLDVLLGKYGDEADKLVFKILRRGEHEASGEADLAMRYDMTVPLARVAAAYGSQLPMPYKRYAMGPVWRADRPGKGRYREFTQCDLDTLGSSSALADAEVLSAVHDTLAALGVSSFSIQLNSRQVLAGLLEAFHVPAELGPGVLTALDKLDKLPPAEVAAELAERGLTESTAAELVDAVLSGNAAQQLAITLKRTERGTAGLEEVARILDLVGPQLPPERIGFSPRMVRGLSYYTGPIWEVTAPSVAGSLAGGGRYDHLIEQLGGPDIPATGGSLGVERILLMLPEADAGSHSQLDVAVPVLDQDLASQSFGLASTARSAGLRAGVYLGGSGKLGRQLKWASDTGARLALIYGRTEEAEAIVTVRDMVTGQQTPVPKAELADYLRRAAEPQTS
jgi:histidyl-tRNA synthetase